jgi:lysophospholipase L1-like esterase
LIVAGATASLFLGSTAPAAPRSSDTPKSSDGEARVTVAHGPSVTDLYREALQACERTLYQGIRENDSPGARVAVLGDSGENQLRELGLADPLLHWISNTQCGEQFRTAIDDGRLAAVLDRYPDVLILGLGNNDFNEEFQFRPDLVPTALADIEHTLDLTEGVPCRVIVNLPRVAPVTMPAAQQAGWLAAATEVNAAFDAAEARPGVHVADWASTIEGDWQRYTIDTIHLTRAGIKARWNLEQEAMRRCPKPASAW